MWDIRVNKHAVVAREGQRRIVLRHHEVLLVDFAAQGRRLVRWHTAPYLALLRLLNVLDPAACEALWDTYETLDRRDDGH